MIIKITQHGGNFFCLTNIFRSGYKSLQIASDSLIQFDLIYFFFLIGLIYLTFVLYFKLKSENSNFLSYTKWVKYFLFILIFIRLGENNNIRIAYSDLLSGRAYKYDRELRDRYKAIQNNEKDTLVIPKLTSLPKTIHFEDIRSNPKHWINQCYKSYFNQKEIILKSNID